MALNLKIIIIYRVARAKTESMSFTGSKVAGKKYIYNYDYRYNVRCNIYNIRYYFINNRIH